jgi:hypothetical protein
MSGPSTVKDRTHFGASDHGTQRGIALGPRSDPRGFA